MNPGSRMWSINKHTIVRDVKISLKPEPPQSCSHPRVSVSLWLEEPCNLVPFKSGKVANFFLLLHPYPKRFFFNSANKGCPNASSLQSFDHSTTLFGSHADEERTGCYGA